MNRSVDIIPTPPPKGGRKKRRRRPRRMTSLLAHGEPMVWLTGGALAVGLAMIAGLLVLVLYQGLSTFWPKELIEIEVANGERWLGEVERTEEFVAEEGAPPETRTLLRTGNRQLNGAGFRWISEAEVVELTRPEWAFVVERLEWGRFYGTPVAFRIDGEVVAGAPEDVLELYREHHGPSVARYEERRDLDTDELGRLNHRLESARLDVREAQLVEPEGGERTEAARAKYRELEAEVQEEFDAIRARTAALEKENARYEIVFETSTGVQKSMVVADIVRAYPANRLGAMAKTGVYLDRWWEYLSDDPREANAEGGVYPAIFGTVAMTMIMSILVVPFGVLSALYLREYAKQGVVVSLVKIAVGNLASVPSIVFGVFGLGFFCYFVGGAIDSSYLPFQARLPQPTFGKGGILWASLTLALLTLPVVIVATEEALAAVPNSMREGSYACGATKWQTIRRIVLPRAAPGIMTGMILAIARGAGEVAPLMLVGAVKLAPELPFDGVFPFVHPERSFMHLGFHIFDLGFQSPDSQAAQPMVYTTTLLLIAIVVALNVLAIQVRSRLRRKLEGTPA